MGVDRGVAVPGEVLHARADAGGLQPGDVGLGVPRDEQRVSAEGPHTDHRVVRVAVDVDDRGRVEVDPGSEQLPTDRPSDRLGEHDIVDATQRGVAGVRAALGLVQPRDVATLLVGRDQHVRRDGAHRRRQGRELVGRGDVRAEQAHRAEAGLESRGHPRRQRRPREGPHDDSRRELVQVGHVSP
jgi:hypothetical protein